MKRLILLLDGTWNHDRDPGSVTNIFQLRKLLEKANRDPDLTVPQRLYYDEGVGTGPFDRFIGGALGVGLSENVRQAYRFLSQFYVTGDEIYIFGFSRGAFTARSLAGFVAASGLLKKESCDAVNLKSAWAYYRTPPKKRMPAKKAQLEQLCSPDVSIKFLGVFDTVGALGVPGKLRSIGARWTQFHDTKLGSAIEYAFHAVSIDERRGAYKPALWAEPDHANNKAVEQVWFPGVHSDIGGGFSDGATTEEDSVTRAVLFWMISRLQKFTELAIELPDPPLRPRIARPHDGYFGNFFFSRRKPTFRLIKEVPLDMPLKRAKRFREYKLPHPDRPYLEYLHVSALDVLISQLPHGYWPWNLLSCVKSPERNPLPVVGYDGELLSAEEVQSRCKRIIAELE